MKNFILIISTFIFISVFYVSCDKNDTDITDLTDTTDIDTVPIDTIIVDTTVIDSGSAPVALDVIENIEKNDTISITISDYTSDEDDNISNISVNLIGNSNVEVIIDGNNITVTSSNNYFGVIGGTYTVTDTKNNTTIGDITINIGNANQRATYKLISKYFGENKFKDNDLVLSHNTIMLREYNIKFYGYENKFDNYIINENGEFVLSDSNYGYSHYSVSLESSKLNGYTIYSLKFTNIHATLSGFVFLFQIL